MAAFDFAIRGKSVGYLPGAGDDTMASLEQLGYVVTPLTGPDLTPEKLRRFDAVVIGVRAFNERTDLAANFPGLLAYAEAGGTVIAQYNRPNGLRTPELGPYALSIQGQSAAVAGDGRNCARHLPRARPPGAHHAQQNYQRGFRRLGAGTRRVFSQQLGRGPLRRAAGHERPRRDRAEQQPAHRAARQGLLRLHQPGVFPPAPRRGSGRLPALRQSDFIGQMSLAAHAKGGWGRRPRREFSRRAHRRCGAASGHAPPHEAAPGRKTKPPACRGRAPGGACMGSCSACSFSGSACSCADRAIFVNALDYAILLVTLLAIAGYGMWRTRTRRSLDTYLRGARDTSWLTIGVSVMATQASATTFLSTPGPELPERDRFHPKLLWRAARHGRHRQGLPADVSPA